MEILVIPVAIAVIVIVVVVGTLACLLDGAVSRHEQSG